MTTANVSTIRCHQRAAAPVEQGTVDLKAIKTRQQATWASGDYAIIGTRLSIVGESLCEALDLRAGQRVLDVATGNGNAALAAARRWCRVAGIDYVPELIAHARVRATAERLPVVFDQGDAERLDYADGCFDAVLSVVGVMFAADQEQAGRELLRVCRSGGKIGLANWTPEGFVGQLFKIVSRYVPPAPGLKSPLLWGTESRLAELFGEAAADIQVTRRHYVFRYRSAAHWMEVFRTYYGPVHKAYGALDGQNQARLSLDLLELLDHSNRSGDETLVIPSEYLEVVVTRK